MKKGYRFIRKSYAMNRMAKAIERAIEANTIKEKDRAARWAAAWGLLCGIRTSPVNLKRNDIVRLYGAGDASDGANHINFPEIVFTPAASSANSPA